MKKFVVSYGGIILFYSVIVFGVLLLNLRFQYLNNREINNNYIAMNN